MDYIFSSESSKNFCCKKCHYTTSRKSQWDRHILTLKHLKDDAELQINAVKSSTLELQYKCVCGMSYKHRQGLWKHSKNCLKNEENKNEEIKNEFIIKDDKEMKDLIMEVLHENKELRKIISDIIPKIGNTTNNNNSHNKTFNLQVFLNETCKDAMNIMDFIDSIKIQLEDLEDVGKLGYINGISNIIMKNLKELDVTQRPVHCSDSKRETLYVKDQDKWEKEDETNSRLRKAIRRIAYKNTKVIRDWRDIHPDHDNSFSKTSDIYQQIVIESMGGKYYETMDTEAKIIKNIAKHVVIDK